MRNRYAKEMRQRNAMCPLVRDVILLCLLFSSLQSAVCNESHCVSTLPQNVSGLRSLVKGSSLPTLTHWYSQVRLFPDITFNCSGSIVGWSVIAARHRQRGGRPIINIWTPSSDGTQFSQGPSSSRLIPCLKGEISRDNNLYLYENITERPVEFKRGDILGMLLHIQHRAAFRPYFMARESFAANYRTANIRPRQTERLSDYRSDNQMPLLFLHICSREDEESYQKCVEGYSRLPTCKDFADITDPAPTHSPSSTTIPSGSRGDRGGISRAALAAALAGPLGLALLIVLVALVLVLLYIWLVRWRRRRAGEKSRGDTVADNSGINQRDSLGMNGAQPYAEPVVRPSPQPSPRSRTPLPPPPVPGLNVQPTYAVLDGPTPSPPPPYNLELELRKPTRNNLQSPEYETIDKLPRKAGLLLLQNATQTSVDSAGYSKVAEREENLEEQNEL